jgi:hypothetical protein
VATGDEMVMPLPMMTTDPPIGRLVKDAPGLHHHMPTPRSLIVACACGHAIGVTVFAIAVVRGSRLECRQWVVCGHSIHRHRVDQERLCCKLLGGRLRGNIMRSLRSTLVWGAALAAISAGLLAPSLPTHTRSTSGMKRPMIAYGFIFT